MIVPFVIQPRPPLLSPGAFPVPATLHVSRPAHLLVVDDDSAMRTLLSGWFRNAGYRVSTAADGEAAWDILCVETVDVLITDHDMPKLTGLDLLRRVRAGPLELPVILMSGDMPWNVPDLAPLLPPGVTLEKPFLVSRLQILVEGLLTPEPATRDLPSPVRAVG